MQPLDLRELEAALDGLVTDLDGNSLEGLMVEAGGIVQSRWRDNILSAGLVESGEYLESIAVGVLDKSPTRIRVSVQSDARDEDGFPYPVVLEYGDSDVPARPVGMQAFDQSRRRVVSTVSSALERKVKSRARK